MPTWLIVTLVVVIAAPGAIIVLAGVLALLIAPAPGAKGESLPDSVAEAEPAADVVAGEIVEERESR
jgi:hypothetical protein